MRKNNTTQQAADALGCSIHNVRRLIRIGELRAFRLGVNGTFRIPQSEIDRMQAAARR